MRLGAFEGHPEDAPEISVVVPVFDEEATLETLTQRLVRTLDALCKRYELVFVDDGSSDASLERLHAIQRKLPDRVVVVELIRNFGQHPAVLAGLRTAQGRVVVTLDADLQNPPEEIPRLLRAIDAGHDVAGGYRAVRHDTWLRRQVSKAANWSRARLTVLRMRDHGCMLRAYRRDVVDRIVESRETMTFVPALALLYASNPTEVEVAHSPRDAGHSKYGLYRLVRLNFDLITGFSAAPLQAFTIFGGVVSAMSGAMVILLAARRLILGPEVEGIFTLMGILFFLMGVAITGLGLVGEYVARIYHEVRRRPPYVIRAIRGSHDG